MLRLDFLEAFIALTTFVVPGLGGDLESRRGFEVSEVLYVGFFVINVAEFVQLYLAGCALGCLCRNK